MHIEAECSYFLVRLPWVLSTFSQGVALGYYVMGLRP